MGDLFVLNFLTIVTEFIGVSLALGYFGVSRYLAVPLAAVALVAITSTGSFRSWERFMYVFVIANFLVIPLLVLAHPHVGDIVQHTFVPGIHGGAGSTAVLLIIAIVGTTVAPWQLFFQQSNIIDKRITPRWINYERADTVIGAFVVVIGAGALIAVTAFAFGGTSDFGQFADAGTVATRAGPSPGLKRGHIVRDRAAQRVADRRGGGHARDLIRLRRRVRRHALAEPRAAGREAVLRELHAMVLAAAGIVLIPGAPLGLITTSVQALAGVLLPSATVFLLLLCNDREVLGPWVNAPWLNVLAAVDHRSARRALPDPDGEHDVPDRQRDAPVRRAVDRPGGDAGGGRDLHPARRVGAGGSRTSRRSPGTSATRGRCPRSRCSSGRCGRRGARRECCCCAAISWWRCCCWLSRQSSSAISNRVRNVTRT